MGAITVGYTGVGWPGQVNGGVGVRRRPLGRQAGQSQAVNGLREELLGEPGPEEAAGPR